MGISSQLLVDYKCKVEHGDNLLIDIVEIKWQYGILMGHE
jgi:hypothetical protein